MEWLNIILGALATLFAGMNIYQLLAFRQYKSKYKAIAEKEKAEADESKQSALERRLDSLEKLYASQGELIDSLRSEVIKRSKEQFESEKRIVQLEGENKTLREKVDWLEKDVQAYKTLYEKAMSGEHRF